MRDDDDVAKAISECDARAWVSITSLLSLVSYFLLTAAQRRRRRKIEVTFSTRFSI